MLLVFFKYVLASKAVFFLYISLRYLFFCYRACPLHMHSYLLVYQESVELLSFLSRQQGSTKTRFISWKHSFLGVILAEFLVHLLLLHSSYKLLAKPTEFEQSSIAYVWPWYVLHNVIFVISVVKDSMEIIEFLLCKLVFFLTPGVL